MTQLLDSRVPSPKDLYETRAGSMADVLRNAVHHQLTWKLWLAAMAEEQMASDMRRRELAIVRLNPKSAFRGYPNGG